jgi:hypothetical protein
MYQSDWLLRQIEQMGDALRRLMDALREHRPEEALRLSDEAIEELLDVDGGIILSLSGDGLVTLLSAGGEFDTFRAHVLAEILVARVGVLRGLGREAEGASERVQARTLLNAERPLVEGAQAERVAELLGWLDEG